MEQKAAESIEKRHVLTKQMVSAAQVKYEDRKNAVDTAVEEKVTKHRLREKKHAENSVKKAEKVKSHLAQQLESSQKTKVAVAARAQAARKAGYEALQKHVKRQDQRLQKAIETVGQSKEFQFAKEARKQGVRNAVETAQQQEE